MRLAVVIVGTAWVILGIAPAPVAAQHLLDEPVRPAVADNTTTADTSAAVPPVASLALVFGADAAGSVQGFPPPQAIPEVEMTPKAASHQVLVPLYISAAALQMMDVHSTRRALSMGYTEGNPLMSGIASNTTALVAVKAATVATTIWMAEKLRKRNRVAAIGLMVAVNAATATIVAHNYRVTR
jgi:hypothetical protein